VRYIMTAFVLIGEEQADRLIESLTAGNV